MGARQRAIMIEVDGMVKTLMKEGSDVDYKDENVWLMQGDCLERMKEIADGSVDAVICDPPYGTTACKWDSVIPLDKMWEQLKRIIKPNGAIVMTASQPFTTVLISSNIGKFRYTWVWDKRYPSNYPQAKRQPMKRHEDVVVFGIESPVYYPQMIEMDVPIKKGKNGGAEVFNKGLEREDYKGKVYTHKYPESVQLFPTRSEGKSIHPTQNQLP